MSPSIATLRTDVYGLVSPDALRGSLAGKVALVTGSSRGIGKHIARALAEAGASVAVTGRDEASVKSACADISQHQTPCAPFVADVLNERDLERLVKEVETQLGPIDILILNAGTNMFMPFHLHEADSWWHMMELNVRAPVALTRLVLPGMKQRNSGTILYISSRAALADLPWTTAYNCSKAALLRFAGSLSAELDFLQKRDGFEKNGIQIFSIHPGEINTDLHKTSKPENLRSDAPYVLELLEKLSANRPTFSPQLPAWSVVYLAAGKAPELRGQYVDCTRDLEETARNARASKC
ncbi:hypothetical protein BDY17DRAFT_292546 [Neohortaea acidophila]|uniref:NAD(P)-binding protein n=1 Tax=Neohortaea acidophila TaxID=245834 RepID=A0A6A6Q0E4_9PEZI|nr:uncharacterized protein BDY17DRAFT_292546 [Neohortaea acidophila]KAF2484887.1 hypothetical protein BDY17DRAFT_292546 [Neohortaea acidophila]